MLYVNTTAPAVVGICKILAGACLSCSSVKNASDAPKSTV